MALLGGLLVAGAGTAIAVETTSEETADSSIEFDQQPALETVQIGQLADDDILVGEEIVVEEDGIIAEADTADVELITAQIGDAERSTDSDAGRQDIMMVSEQTWAMHTDWATFYPASGPVEQIAETEVMTESSTEELRSQSFTAIGELLGWEDLGWEIDDVYNFDCNRDESYTKDWPPWQSENYGWCGWHGDAGSPDDEMYHIDADTTISLLMGFDIDRDNSHFDEMLLTENSPDGEWSELPSADRGLVTGLFGEGYWHWVDDDIDPTVDDFVAEDPAFDVAADIENELNYIEYNTGADIYGFDSQEAADTWVRVNYDNPLAAVEDMKPYDPFADRYNAMGTVAEILHGSEEDHRAGVVINDKLGQDDQGHDLTDDVLGLHEYLFEQRIDLSEEDGGFQPTEEFFEFKVDDGFATAINELETAPNAAEDQTIIIVSGGHAPQAPQSEWYEYIHDGIHDVVHDWILDPINDVYPGDDILDSWDKFFDRPEPEEVGEQLDAEFQQLAESTDAEIVTVGLGPSHDAYRLAMTADAGSEESNCLEDLDSEDCNYVSVENTNDLEDELVQMIFGDDVTYDIERSHADLSVGDYEFEDINDPSDFTHNSPTAINNPEDEVGVRRGEAIDIDLTLEDGNCASSVEEEFTLGDSDVTAEANHYDCDSGFDLGVDTTEQYFTDGDDLDDLSQITSPEWAANPSDIIEDEYGEFVDTTFHQFDLVDSSEGTEGVIVGVEISDDAAEGYALFHVEMETGASPEFDVEIQEDELADANEDVWHDLDPVSGLPAGEEMTIPVEITNNGASGEQHVTLQHEGDGSIDPVVDSTSLELDDGESVIHEFTWETGETDAGFTGDLIATSESEQYITDEPVDVVDPGMDLRVSIRANSLVDDDLNELDQPLNLTKLIQEGTTVGIPVSISNTGAEGATDLALSLGVGDSVASTTEPIAGFGTTVEEGGKTYYDNETYLFEWEPAYGDLEELEVADRDQLGDSIHVVAEAGAESDTNEIEVIYVPLDEDDELDLDDVEDGEVDPLDVDISEIEIEG